MSEGCYACPELLNENYVHWFSGGGYHGEGGQHVHRNLAPLPVEIPTYIAGCTRLVTTTG